MHPRGPTSDRNEHRTRRQSRGQGGTLYPEIKERLRTCAHGIPFQRLPKLLLRHMVDDAVRCLNQFPWKNGISADMSPAALVTGHLPPNFNSMLLKFGIYVQIFEDNNPTSTPRAHSLGAIALNPTGNAQGDFYFLSRPPRRSQLMR